jgi:2-polyprenyl-3-methyl-5-hydroxy-6-metoxy-1,4-benzoquinol methylase
LSSDPVLKKNERYNEAAGLPISALSVLDFYRFKKVKRYLQGKSILDIGPGRAHFLDSIKADHQITGVDMNMERVRYGNQILGQDAIKLGNLEKGLDFPHGSFDTVTCLEVLEHLENPQEALAELARISRKRIIVTVPFNERIQYVLCIHCAQYTPYSGHLHCFDRASIRGIVPNNAKIVKMELIGNKALSIIPYLGSIVFRAPLWIASLVDKLSNAVIRRARWMLVVLDKE